MSLPSDVVLKILEYLPVKSLVRFRCACKSWQTVIADPAFVRAHLKKKSNKFLVAFNRGYSSREEFYFLRRDEAPRVEYPPVLRRPLNLHVATCNGLLCLWAPFVFSSQIYLWNPSLGESRSIPSFWFPYTERANYVKIGFGFHGLSDGTDDYKVIKIWYDSQTQGTVEVSVYSLKEDSWKNIVDGIPSKFPVVDDCNQVMFNGSIHWLSYRGNTDLITSYDIAGEAFHEMAIPDRRGDVERHVGVMEGCLSISNYAMHEKEVWEVWVMKEYGVADSWTKLVVVMPHPFADAILRPLGFTWTGDVLLEDVFYGDLISVDTKGGVVLDFNVNMYVDGGLFYLRTYAESLVSVIRKSSLLV